MDRPDDKSTLQNQAGDLGIDVASVELAVVEGAQRGRRVALRMGTLRIGSAPANELALDDPHVSRVHCEIRTGRDTITVTDSGSTNGTWVDGVRVGSAQLAHNNLIRVGSTALRVEVGDATTRVPLSSRAHFGGLLGASLEMRLVYAVLSRAAATQATVLLQGETGTGKEVAARAVHDASPRREGPFVPVDCGAIAATLIESELFGHARGAFSGAVSERRGLFEEASGGTIFLDEVGELPLSLQPRLLRALETREVRRVGSNQPRPIDVRVVAATNRPLGRAVNEGGFREDLYYRLAVVEVELPPLRARRADIPLLARAFNERFNPGGDPIPADVLSSMSHRSWPGNVRELRNFVERGASLGWQIDRLTARPPEDPGDRLTGALESLVEADLPLADARAKFVLAFERAYVQKLLRATDGNVTRAAELAGVHRRSIQRLVNRSAGGEGDDDG